MEQYDDDLACIQALMVRLRTLSSPPSSGRKLYSVLMIHRYLKLLEHLDPTDDDIVDVLPAPACNKSLLSLLKDLKKVESVSKALQRANVTCVCGSRLNRRKVTLRQVSYQICRFINIYICVTQDLVRTSCTAPTLSRVRTCSWREPPVDEGREVGAAALSLRGGRAITHCREGLLTRHRRRRLKRRRLAAVEPRYDLLSCIPPTSNLVERFLASPGRRTGKSATACSPSHWKWCCSCVKMVSIGQHRLSMRPLVNNQHGVVLLYIMLLLFLTHRRCHYVWLGTCCSMPLFMLRQGSR
ncbi:hypothetical protein GQ600_27835 [Phytophthora cactorum]|nr:hypothetical protein GQ600_27835 [Phytophthora cactorum]